MCYGRIPIVKYFRVFQRKCYIRRDDKKLGKFDARSNEGIFLVYNTKIKAYRCYKKSLRRIFESASVKVDEELRNSVVIDGYESDAPTYRGGEEEKAKENEVQNKEEEAPKKMPKYA